MLQNKFVQFVKLAAVAATMLLILASVAWGDDGYRDEAGEHGFRNGYQDGIRAGHYDRERGYRFHVKNDQWEDAPGFERWMGSHGQYKHAYRDGYEHGYRRAYDHDYRDYDRDDYRSRPR